MSIARRLSAAALAALMTLGLTACSGGGEGGSTAAKSGLEDGVLTVAMECAYAPYNWTQADDSNGAVRIKDTMLMATMLSLQRSWQRNWALNWKSLRATGIA